MVKKLPAVQETQVQNLGQEDLLERKWKSTPVSLPGKFHGQGAWQATVHGIAKSQTRLSGFFFLSFSSFLPSFFPWNIIHKLYAVIHIVKSFRVVNEAEVDIFLEFPCSFYDPTDTGNLTFGSSAFSKSSLYIWKFLVHILLKRSLKDFEHYLPSMWNECNCEVIGTFFVIALLWDWNENGPFPVL